MKVWIVNPFDNLPSEGTRPQRYWLMAEAFVQKGYQVVYWTSDFSHATKQQRAAVENCSGKADGIKVVQIPTLPYAKNVCWARVRSHRQLARDFEILALQEVGNSSPDLVVASTPPLGLCASAMKVARSFGAKFVVDIQDAWPETFVRLLPSGLKWLRFALFAPMYLTARQIYHKADRVTGVSARYAELSRREDFYLAYHGIAGAAKSADARKAGGSPRNLVYIGNLGNGYDLETVIAAVARRPNLTLRIAGLGPKEQVLKAKVKSQGLEDRVRFLDYLGAADLTRLLASSDVGIIPMRDDSWVGLPYKLGDYLKAGLPVISSLHGECGKLLKRMACGVTYEYGQVDSLLAALDALPTNSIALPDELCAERIYPAYVQQVLS